MEGNWRKKADLAMKELKDKTAAISDSARKELKSSGVTDKLNDAAGRTKKYLDETGVTAKAKQVSATVNDHMDVVAGAKQLQLVEQHLQLQAEYNDILASKLEEALDRIAALESQLSANKRGA